MTKRPLGHGNLKNMSNFKAVAADYEYYLSLSDEGQLYCLSERQVYVLQVQLTYVGWLTRWYNTEDITQTTVELIQSDIMEALMSCVDVSVLVNQGKLTLTNTVQNQQIQSAGLRQIYEDRYDGSPTSINPDAPTTVFGASGDRYDALCAALTAFVYQFAKCQAEAVIAADITAFALLAGVAILLIPGLNLFFIAGAALALVAGGGIIGVTTAVAVEALTDTDALGEVICFMRDTLASESVSEANWTACLDGYPFSTGSHAAIVADFIKPTLATNYLPVLDMLGQAYSGTINNEPLPECPCAPTPPPDPRCEYLSEDQGLWAPYMGNTVFGTFYPSEGLGGTQYLSTPDYVFIWQRNISPTTDVVNRIKVVFNQPTTNFIIATSGGSYTYSGSPVTTLDINSTIAPGVLPYDLHITNVVLRPSNGGANTDSTFRVTTFCSYPA